MLDTPLFRNLSEKSYDIALLVCVTFMYVSVCAETDMYVPAFPAMIKYFGIEEYKIQLILSLNFGGLSVTGLIVGPFSDGFGRRKILLGGLLLFVISSMGCVVTASFNVMLFWRFFQGMGAAIPMVIGGAMFFDKYSKEKAGKLIGMMNGIIAASMAGAPMVGAWISQIFNWRPVIHGKDLWSLMLP